jgi:hypothetical protein
VHVPLEPLRCVLAGLPRGRVLFLVEEAGKAFTVDSLARRFREVLEAEDPEGGWGELQVRDTRRTGGVALAEADCIIP